MLVLVVIAVVFTFSIWYINFVDKMVAPHNGFVCAEKLNEAVEI